MIKNSFYIFYEIQLATTVIRYDHSRASMFNGQTSVFGSIDAFQNDRQRGLFFLCFYYTVTVKILFFFILLLRNKKQSVHTNAHETQKLTLFLLFAIHLKKKPLIWSSRYPSMKEKHQEENEKCRFSLSLCLIAQSEED